MTEPIQQPLPIHARRAAASTDPWWRHAMVWMVIATPALAVAASVTVAVLAWRDADLEIDTTRDAVVAPSAQSTAHAGSAKAPTAPALQARNHAATPRP